MAIVLAVALVGCSSLPGSGPSREAVIQSGSESPSNAEPSFALVEIGDYVVDVLARQSPSTLRGNFGDYRPPVTPLIDVGDSLQITLWEAAAGGLFSAPVSDRTSAGSRSATIPDQVVARDGSVTVPYAGRIHVAGRSQKDVESAIVERLKGKAIEPQALVNVTRSVSNTVTVTGEVTSGARVPLTQRGDRIMDVVASAGGFRSPVQETFVTLTRGGRSARVPVQALLTNPREDIYMRPGDILTVERTPQTFTAIGATGSNSVVPFDARGATLEEAIAKVGGLEDMRADPDGVFVLRYEPAAVVREYPLVPLSLLSRSMVPVAYHLNLRDPASLFSARRFPVRDKDIVYVSNSSSTELGKFLRLFNMITQPAMHAAPLAATARVLN